MAASSHDGYTLTLHIPVEWFSGTDTLQSERLRARRRKWVRDDARAEWKRLKRNKVAYKVERFVVRTRWPNASPRPQVSLLLCPFARALRSLSV